jgi:hypothetical protein
VPFNDEIPQYPNTQRNPNDETPNIGTSGHSANRCHGSPHALNQTSLLSSIDLAEDQVEFLYRLPKQRRSLFQVVGFSCSRLVVATSFPRHCPSSTTTFGLGYFVIPWVFGCFVICYLWRSFIPCCLSQTRLTKRHSRLDCQETHTSYRQAKAHSAVGESVQHSGTAGNPITTSHATRYTRHAPLIAACTTRQRALCHAPREPRDRSQEAVLPSICLHK